MENVRNAYKLIKSDREYTRKIGIKHDMPKRRARKDLKLKKETKIRQESEEGQNYQFVVMALLWKMHIMDVKKENLTEGAYLKGTQPQYKERKQ